MKNAHGVIEKKRIAILLIAVFIFVFAPHSSSRADIGSGWLWPVPNNQLTLTQGYKTQTGKHYGIDIKVDGAPVYATKEGTVAMVWSGCKNYSGLGSHTCKELQICTPNLADIDRYYSAQQDFCNWGFGNGVVIRHSDGSYSCYGHMSEVCVENGVYVYQGQRIGTSGSSGKSDGPHLHFALASGSTSVEYNSMSWINDNPKYLSYGIKYGGNTVYDSEGVEYIFTTDQYSLTVSAGTGGTVTNASGTYGPGSVISLSAQPYSGYAFSGWTATAGTLFTPDSANTSFTMPACNATVTAAFELCTYSLEVGSTFGAVDTSVNGSNYCMGSTVTLRALARHGYRFVRWISDNGGQFADSASMTTTFTMPAGNVHITAEYELAEGFYNLTVTATAGGTVNSDISGVYHTGENIPLFAAPDAGYHFVRWEGTTSPDNSAAQNTFLVMPAQHVELRAAFNDLDPAWTEDPAKGSDVRRAQYRSLTQETVVSTETSMEGWTQVGSEAGEWGAWSEWNDSPVEGSVDTEVETRDIDAVTQTTYTYTRWRYYNSSNGNYYTTYHGNYGGTKQTKTSDTPLAKAGTTSDGVQRYNSTSDPWYNESASTQTIAAAHREYRFRTRVRYYTYTRATGSDVWQDAYVSGSEVRILYKIDGSADVLRIPKIETVTEASFENCGALCIVVRDGAKTIESRAFAACPSLVSLTLPGSVTTIADDAFAGCGNLTLFVQKDSYAEFWAERNNFPHQSY